MCFTLDCYLHPYLVHFGICRGPQDSLLPYSLSLSLKVLFPLRYFGIRIIVAKNFKYRPIFGMSKMIFPHYLLFQIFFFTNNLNILLFFPDILKLLSDYLFFIGTIFRSIKSLYAFHCFQSRKKNNRIKTFLEYLYRFPFDPPYHLSNESLYP